MAKYSDIKGFTVQTLSTDTVASQAGGGSWSSGGTKNTIVNVMPKMEEFLRNNGPWSQLVSLQNISITEINNNSKIAIDTNLSLIHI